ncbi:MAG: response regulator [Candidatus Omnitrophica bacterium]|nr:response regulator [Candidatus Omnitrophota bacterium]
MAKVLIVDDKAANRHLLKRELTKASQDYELSEADSGLAVFKAIEQDLPDIILLDIEMPGMDGFEVCQQLKVDEKYKAIPIIFITALEKIADKVKAFKLGAADYIIKPFNSDEVRVRVSAHLKVIEAEKIRVEVEKLNTVKDMVATYNHNMNQPLMVLYTYLGILLERFKESDKERQTLTKMKTELDKINEILKIIQQVEKVQRINYAGNDGMLDLGKLTSGKE